MDHVPGMADLLTELSRLERGHRLEYPFYCLLLSTDAAGDREVSGFVRGNWAELVAATGEHCLVFVLDTDDQRPCWRCGFQWLAPADRACPSCGLPRPSRGWDEDRLPVRDIYLLADMFGVNYDALPCAVFFTEPRRDAEVRTVRLADFIAPGGPPSAATLLQAFRAMSTACARSADAPPPYRLEALQAELIAAHKRLYPQAADDHASALSSANAALQQAAGSVQATQTLGQAGAGLGGLVLRVFGGG